MIKLVLPVCEKEAAMVSRLVHRFKEFDDMKDRDLFITACWSDYFSVPDLVAFLKPHFNSVEAYRMPDVPEFAEWPMVGNHMFYQSAIALYERHNRDPWYFFEADNWPIYRGWLNDFDVDYLGGGKPYMGAVNLTRIGDEGKVNGTHMVGTGVYPFDFLGRVQAVHELDFLPFDVACQDEIVPHCHETPLIFHAWNTGNYSKTSEGQVIGQDLGPNKGRYGGRPIPPATAVVHGCKDGSLARIDFRRSEVTV